MTFISTQNRPTEHKSINITRGFFAFDADKTFTPTMVREPLPSDFVNACLDAHHLTQGGFMIATNSASEGLDEMMHGHQLPALVSQGTRCRFEINGDYHIHPELDQNITAKIDEIDDVAKHLIAEMTPEYKITYNGADLQNHNYRFLKPEHKDTCFCIGFQEHMKGAKEQTQEIINAINHALDLHGQFHIHTGVDAVEIVPLGKDGKPFSKWKGLQWVMNDPQFEHRQLIIAEDSNEDMLSAAHQSYKAFNIAVGHDLPHHTKADYIHANFSNISDFRDGFTRAIKNAKQTQRLSLSRTFMPA